MNRAEIKKTLLTILEDVAFYEIIEEKEDYSFKDDFLLDSLDFVESIMAIEQTFDIIIEDKEVENFTMFNELLDFLEKKLK